MTVIAGHELTPTSACAVRRSIAPGKASRRHPHRQRAVSGRYRTAEDCDWLTPPPCTSPWPPATSVWRQADYRLLSALGRRGGL